MKERSSRSSLSSTLC